MAFIGFAALLSVPGLTGSDVDLSLLRVSRLAFGPWIVGMIGAAGLLTALVPGSLILMSTATTLSRMFRPAVAGQTDSSVTLARGLVPLICAVALAFTFRGGDTLVALLLMAYAMVTQLFPALIASFLRVPRVPAAGGISEHLSAPDAPRPRAISATHYHEPTEPERDRRGLVKIGLDVKEGGGPIVFMRSVVPGRSDKS